MIAYENRCCGCDISCNPYCTRKHTEIHYCDKCGDEISKYEAIEHNGKEYCYRCIEEVEND
jgi:hypothetical protein